MKEKLIVTLLIMFIVIIPMTACNANGTDEPEVFVTIEFHTSYSIVYDKETKVIYAKSNSGTMTFCPLYNSDGTLKLYEENYDE